MRKPTLRLLGLLGFVVAVVLVLVFVPVRRWQEAFQDWVSEGHNRYLALVVLALAYTPAALFFFPATLLTLGAGGLFGLVEATIAVSLGSTLAACVVFLVGRTLARRWVEEKFTASPRFRALDRAVAANGFRIVLLMRLSPAFPYTLLNYAFSLTRVSFRDYFLASWIGMLPGTVMYVSLPHGAKGLVELVVALFQGRAGENLAQTLFLFVGVAATIAATVLVTRIARNALRETIKEEG